MASGRTAEDFPGGQGIFPDHGGRALTNGLFLLRACDGMTRAREAPSDGSASQDQNRGLDRVLGRLDDPACLEPVRRGSPGSVGGVSLDDASGGHRLRARPPAARSCGSRARGGAHAGGQDSDRSVASSGRVDRANLRGDGEQHHRRVPDVRRPPESPASAAPRRPQAPPGDRMARRLLVLESLRKRSTSAASRRSEPPPTRSWTPSGRKHRLLSWT